MIDQRPSQLRSGTDHRISLRSHGARKRYLVQRRKKQTAPPSGSEPSSPQPVPDTFGHSHPLSAPTSYTGEPETMTPLGSVGVAVLP